MFVTLLKQEWRSTKGILGLLCLIILGSGAAIGGSGFYMAWTAEHRFAGNDSVLTVLMSVLLAAAMVAIAVCCAGGVFYYIWRFYQSRFTDEGYLTFTLPVTTHKNLLSSLLNTLLGCVMIGIAAIGAFVIAFGLLILAYNQEIIWQDTFYAIRHFLPDVMEMLRKNAKNFMLFGGFLVTAGISEVIALMLSVTVGSIIAKKHKILAAFGVYWVIGMVNFIVFAVAMVWFPMTEDTSAIFRVPMIMGAVIAVVGYFLMYYLVDKKLNLN